MEGQVTVGTVIAVALVVIITIFLGNSWGTIPPGHRGVFVRLGAVQDKVAGEGFFLKLPFLERVVRMNVQIQKEQVRTDASSKDLQIVHTEVAANLHPKPERIADIYQKLGFGYMDTIVAPMMQESIKSVTAQYNAVELIGKRELVREGIRTLMAEKLVGHGIVVEDINIVNFDFSPSFNQSIEAKVAAEQNALTAKNKLAQIEFEAQQEVAKAKGKAQAIKIESEAIMQNPQILQLRALEKWNGEMPKVTGSVLPFIDVTNLTKK